MKNIKQVAYGSNNNQTTKIFNRPLEVVDICADKIGVVLSKIAHIDFISPSDGKLIPPNIARKNTLNNIDKANSLAIEETYALWDDISTAIRSDASGTVVADYVKSSFILNQLYLSQFQNKFPEFKIYAFKVYCESTSADSDEAFLLMHLIHYMYLSCQVGIKE